VHADETLEEFWRRGRLVPNTAHQHPYQDDVPEKYRDVRRWFLLDTNLDPKRPWERTTNIPVFSMALELGEASNRRWLLYAHSPLEDRRNVEITLPDFGPVTVDVPQAGAFDVIEEKKRSPARLSY
jgi:hypothetical protein